MNHEEFVKRVKLAIIEFIETEKTLISQNPHEDALANRFTRNLEHFFSDLGLDIDFNYNKRVLENELVRKQAEFLIQVLPLKKWPSSWDDGQEAIIKDILPDIIIHNRQNRNNNFLAVEIKKTTNTNNQDRSWDDLKLRAMTGEDLNYDYGLFLDINTMEDSSDKNPFLFQVYENGEIIYSE